MQELILLIIIGIAAGIVGGMTGLGGGIIIVPTLVFLFGFTQVNAQGTSTATLLFPIGILAAYNYHSQDQINWKFALVMAFSFVIGGFLGSKIALSIDEKLVKRIFGCIMLFTAIKMLYGTIK